MVRELISASYLKDHLCPQLIGEARCPAQPSKISWRFFYKGAYWRRGPVAMSDHFLPLILWRCGIIKAKAANMPCINCLVVLLLMRRDGLLPPPGGRWSKSLEDYAKKSTSGWKLKGDSCAVRCTGYANYLWHGRKGKARRMEPATRPVARKSSYWSSESISIYAEVIWSGA